MLSRRGRLPAVCLCLVALATLPGCVRVLAITAKVVMGDPKIKSVFEQRTGMELQRGEKTVAIVLDAPHRVAYDFDTLLADLQDDLLHRMQRNGINVLDPDVVTDALEDAGGRFSARELAERLDVDVIFHVQIEAFTDSRSGNPNLLQSHAQGIVTGYDVRGEFEASDRHVVEVYEESFHSVFPSGHPLAAEQTPRRKFLQQSYGELADEIGRQFYDVTTGELY